MSTQTRLTDKTRRLVYMAILIAIILVMAFTPLGYLKTAGIEITFIQVPVIVGAILMGPAAGAILGGVFGFTSFIQCFGLSAFGAALLEINAVYTHMLGHDCHSIVAGQAHADSIIAELREDIARGYDLILTSHYTPEDLKDAQTKIDYLESLKRLAAGCTDAEAFKAEMRKRYPSYSGQNYLDMTAGFFYA